MIRTYDRINNIIYIQEKQIVAFPIWLNITEEEYSTILLSNPDVKIIQLCYEIYQGESKMAWKPKQL